MSDGSVHVPVAGVVRQTSTPPPPPAMPTATPSTSSVPLTEPSSSTTTSSLGQSLAEFRAQVWDADAKVVLPTLLKIIQNIVAQPSEEKFRSLRLNNPTFRQKLANSNAALQG